MPPNTFNPDVPTAAIEVGDSSEIGFVHPVSAPNAPFTGDTLDDFMQFVVAGVTGLPPDLVRPRWQEEPPTLPPVGTNWASIGVVSDKPLGYPASIEAPDGLSTRQADWEEFDCLCSFYGPKADYYAMVLRQGLLVAQNREAFQLASMNLIQTGGRIRAPAFLQQTWWQRIDIMLYMRREIRLSYPILSFLSAKFQIITDVGYVTPKTP